jgi:hypothetical protein
MDDLLNHLHDSDLLTDELKASIVAFYEPKNTMQVYIKSGHVMSDWEKDWRKENSQATEMFEQIAKLVKDTQVCGKPIKYFELVWQD